MEMTKDNLIHMPDLTFFRWCDEEFGVNRGVYNVIDVWFYEKGVINVVKRRGFILHFLAYARNHYNGERIKFGHGGLSSSLLGYWEYINSNKNHTMNAG